MAQQPTESSITSCPQCGEQRVGMDCTNEMQLVRPSKVISSQVSGLKAIVCLGCGYTMLYAKELPRLKEEIRKHPNSFRY